MNSFSGEHHEFFAKKSLGIHTKWIKNVQCGVPLIFGLKHKTLPNKRVNIFWFLH